MTAEGDDLKHLAETDHDAFLAELDRRIGDWRALCGSGTPEGYAELARFIRAVLGDEELAAIMAERVPEPEPDVDEMIARYHAAVRRMETDPEYAAYIRRIADETDAQLAAEDAAAEGEP